jgi:predicted amidophosphoribosyltransferase
VDDVVTTGASLAAAARALETAGAVGVSGITVARER